MTDAKVTDEFRRKALENLRELQAQFGEATAADLRELQAILGDSPDELDLIPVPREKQLRPKSASTPTA